MSDSKIRVCVTKGMDVDAIQRILDKQGIDHEIFEIKAPEPMPEIPDLALLEDRTPPGIVKPVEDWMRRGRRKNKLFKR